MAQRCSDDDTTRREIPSFIEPRPPLISNPFMRPRPQKAVNLMDQFEEDSDIEEPELVQVYLRMKPCEVPNHLYQVTSDKCLVAALDTTTAGHGRRTQHNVSRQYTFSKIFTAECTQKEVFDEVVKNNLKKLPDGHSFTLLTYGASGSGKTYTLMGTVSSPGLVPRSLEYVFKLVDAAQSPMYRPSDTGADILGVAQQEYELQWVKRLRHISGTLRNKYRRMSAQLRNDLTASSVNLSNRPRYYVWVSFVEIYNEAIYDLLAPPSKRVKMRIREDTSGNVYVKDVTQAFVRSGEEAYDVMVAGKQNLIVAATGVHAHSSRSHCIFTITMLTEIDGDIRTSHVRLCDLAGCERQRAANNTGARMQESRAINSSLHVLERCLHMLRKKQKVVPYRESKLTRLLGSGLSGSRGEAVSMVVTLTPAPQYMQETRHVLSLAAVVQDIQINNTMFSATSLETLESSTQDTTSAEVMRLRADNEMLQFELLQSENRNRELQATIEESQKQNGITMNEVVEETKDSLQEYYGAQIRSLEDKMEDMKEEYEALLAEARLRPAISTAGTPSRYYEAQVAKLMAEVAVLQDELAEVKRALSRKEMEIEHLHSCIEERDRQYDKTQKENSSDDNAIIIESDHESEDDTSDLLNESLEPVFKIKYENKSFANKNKVSEVVEDNKEDVEDTAYNSDENTSSNDTFTHNSVTHDSISDVHVEPESEQFAVNERDSVYNECETVESFHQNIEDASEEKHTSVTSFKSMDNTTDKDRSVCEELVQQSSKLDERPEHKPQRGTYFIKTDDIQKYLKEDFEKEHASRNTYCVEEPEPNAITEKDDNTNHEQPTTGSVIAKNKPETFMNKIINSLKSNKYSNSSDSSLRQFEQLEMAANAMEDTKDETTYFVDVKTSKQKKNYFEKISEDERSDEPSEIAGKPIGSKNAVLDVSEEVEKKTNANKNKTNDVKLSNSQENHLEPCNGKNIENKTELSTNSADAGVHVSLSAAAQTQEKHLYFSDSDKSVSNDVIISSSDKQKSPYKTEVTVSNKKINNVIAQCVKNIERSPSIVKDDSAFEPNSAMKKLLGENISKPELLSSIRKHKGYSNKQESVDVFESPQIDLPKRTGAPNVPSNTGANHNVNSDFTVAPVDSLKALSTVEMVRKPIEQHVIKQRSKTPTPDIGLDPAKTDLTANVNKTELVFNIPKISMKADQTVTEDNTIDKFEGIYKDLTHSRATEFDFLVSQEINTSDMKNESAKMDVAEIAEHIKINALERPKAKTKVEEKKITEETKKFEEVKYNLRHKGKSNNHDTSKENDTETLAKSLFKCEKAKNLTKRNLRLRRRNELDDNADQTYDTKLKDIINLKKQFCDVTMGLPAPEKVVRDIPSPETVQGEGENISPLLGIQSCPAKSVHRSRRKLFTPRAEPLDESATRVGDSNERIHVPRPSYHRSRSRRKL